jgi:hypothetical protein
MTIMAKITYTTATLAADLDTTPKELRKFLRSDLSGIEKVGKGGRYSLEVTATQLKSIKKNFTAWVAEGDAHRAAKVAKVIEVEVTEGDGAVTEADIAELDEEFAITDPTADDLELIDADLEEIDLDEV